MDREQFFRELCTVLGREGFTTQPEQDDLLPVEWDSRPLCRITEGGGVRYWQEDVATSERNQACERATDLACTVREYMTLLEQAPPLQAQSLTGDYRLLADFQWSRAGCPSHPAWRPIRHMGLELRPHRSQSGQLLSGKLCRCQAGLRHPRRPHFQTADLQSGAAYRNLPVLL